MSFPWKIRETSIDFGDVPAMFYPHTQSLPDAHVTAQLSAGVSMRLPMSESTDRLPAAWLSVDLGKPVSMTCRESRAADGHLDIRYIDRDR